MRCWLIEIGEPLPIDVGGPRLMRTGLVAQTLADRGHDVVWWASRFDQGKRVDRGPELPETFTQGGLTIRLLEGAGYRRSLSLQRIGYHRATAANFKRLAAEASVPDIIVCSMPTLEMAAAAVAYGTTHGVPVLLDLRDLWPDIWLEFMPKVVRPVFRMLFRNVFSKFVATASAATGLIGITDEFLDWGLGYAGRARSEVDRVVCHAYPKPFLPEVDLAAAAQRWKGLGITGRNDQFVVCYIGSLTERITKHVFLQDAVTAFVRLAERYPDLRLVICGGGEELDHWSRIAAPHPNVIVSGRVDHADLVVLMERSRAGLVPYPNTPDFAKSLPNKVAEYVSADLPVISSLDGALGKFLRDNDCGTIYRVGDPASLEREIEDLHQHPETWTRMSGNAALAYADHLSADRVYGDLVDHLVSVAGHPNDADEGIDP